MNSLVNLFFFDGSIKRPLHIKHYRKMNHIERFNLTLNNETLRQRISRLVRKTLSFSKKIENHIGASGRRAHHRCKVLGCPFRMDFSRAACRDTWAIGKSTSAKRLHSLGVTTAAIPSTGGR